MNMIITWLFSAWYGKLFLLVLFLQIIFIQFFLAVKNKIYLNR